MWGVAELLIYNSSYFWVFLNAGAGSYTACTIWAIIYTACTIWATIYMACNYSVLAKHWKHGITVRPRFNAAPI